MQKTARLSIAVVASLVTAAIAQSAPEPEPAWRASVLDTGGGPKGLLACSGYWGLVESEDGVRGWWRSLCSNQVTNCS
jgi:hypothetical protein